MRIDRLVLIAALALLASLACDGGGAPPEASPTSLASPTTATDFPEGRVTVHVDLIDTGLLKGTARAEAAEGWKVTAVRVSAVDPKGAKWPVLEFPEGLGTKTAEEFFEVVLQELPRGEQLEVTATATFENGQGEEVKRDGMDHWPP